MKTHRQTRTTRFVETRRLRPAWALLALLPWLSLSALGAQQGDFYYQAHGGGAVVTAYVGPGGAVVIPDQLGGLPVKSIGDWGATAFRRRTNVTSVTIPNGVTNLGPSAFSECTGLTNVVIPNSVTRIHYFAFDGCSGLTSVTIPNSITAIEQETFARCTRLTNITLPSSLVSIGTRAFSGCTALTSIAIPNGATIIGGFEGCSALTNITIPDSATYVGPFPGCTNLTTIEVSALNPAFSIVDGVLFNKAQTKLVACPGRKAGSYPVPNTVTHIGQGAFADCTLLTNVAIPNSVTIIGQNAFAACVGLTTITIPDSVTSVEPFAFSGCTGLRAIDVDALNPKFSSVDGVVFNKVQTEIILCPGGKTGNYVIPSSVTCLGGRAFEGCIRLTSIIIPASVACADNYTFPGCTSLTNVSLPNSLSTLTDFMFRDCTSLTSITIPNSVTFLGEGVFWGCTGLKSVAVPSSVRGMDGGVFWGCTGLTNATAFKLGEWMFYGCTALKSFIIPTNVTYIPDGAFQQCSGLVTITIPNSVTNIDSFQGCISLTNITIPQSVTGIREFAFEGCASLTSIVIPSSVGSISDDAFANCRNLVSVYFEGTPPSLPGEFYAPFDGSLFVTAFYRSGTPGWGSIYGHRPTAIWAVRPSYADWAVSTSLSAQFPDASGESDDADGDGVNNGDEWFSGTDPTQSASLLELELTPRPADLAVSDQTPVNAGQFAAYFRSVPGIYYGVESTTEVGGVWTIQAVRAASAVQTRVLLPVAGSKAFYRVLALP